MSEFQETNIQSTATTPRWVGLAIAAPRRTFLDRHRSRLECFEPRQIRRTVNASFFEAAK